VLSDPGPIEETTRSRGCRIDIVRRARPRIAERCARVKNVTVRGDQHLTLLEARPELELRQIEDGIQYIERNPAPGTENDPPQPAFTIDVRALTEI